MFARATKGQFSLRILILVIVVMACGLAYLNWCRSRANREQAIVKRYGADARYYFQYDEDKGYDSKAEPPGPWFLRRVWGDLAFARVREIFIDSEALTCVDDLPELTGLKRVVINDCKRLECVDGLANTRLRSLHISGCPLLKNIDSLANQKDLKYFKLFGCVSVQNVDGLRGTNLKWFTLRNCPLVSDIDSLANQKDLEYCDLVECSGLENVDGLNEGVWPLLNVKEVRLSRFSNLQTLEGVDEASELEKLVLSECRSLTSLKGLENSKADAVSIFRCDELSDISALDSMVNLKHVEFWHCPNVDLGEIAALQNKLQKRP